MYRIQGYIARTVNHDQKVPKHWREIENERGKEKQKKKRKKVSKRELYLYIILDRIRTIDNVEFTITRTRCIHTYIHTYTHAHTHIHTYERAYRMHIRIHKERKGKEKKKKKGRKNTTVFQYHYSSSCTSFLILTHALTRFSNQTFFFSGQREGSRILPSFE